MMNDCDFLPPHLASILFPDRKEQIDQHKLLPTATAASVWRYIALAILETLAIAFHPAAS